MDSSSDQIIESIQVIETMIECLYSTPKDQCVSCQPSEGWKLYQTQQQQVLAQLKQTKITCQKKLISEKTFGKFEQPQVISNRYCKYQKTNLLNWQKTSQINGPISKNYQQSLKLQSHQYQYENQKGFENDRTPQKCQKIKQKNNQRIQTRPDKRFIDNCKPSKYKHLFMPQQRFYYYGISIKVLSGSIFNLKKNVLVIPFSNISLVQPLPNLIAHKLTYNIFKEFEKQNLDKEIVNGSLTCKKAKGIINYYGLYWIKSPEYPMGSHSKNSLIKAIDNIFSSLVQFQDKSIVFPNIFWKGLNLEEMSMVMIDTIMKNIRIHRNCLALKEINIVLNNKQSFLQFSQKLRQISDLYVKNGY